MRVCDGCGREYSPKSGKQRFCSLRCPGRGVPDRPRGFVPLRWPERECVRPGCGQRFVPKVENQTFCCEVCRLVARRPLQQLLYDMGHQARRRRWRTAVAAGGVRCARGAACRFAEGELGGFIRPGQRWDLGHPDGESAGGPEHWVCNRGAPSRLRQRKEAEHD
jgi:hypothetical protein